MKMCRKDTDMGNVTRSRIASIQEKRIAEEKKIQFSAPVRAFFRKTFRNIAIAYQYVNSCCVDKIK